MNNRILPGEVVSFLVINYDDTAEALVDFDAPPAVILVGDGTASASVTKVVDGVYKVTISGTPTTLGSALAAIVTAEVGAVHQHEIREFLVSTDVPTADAQRALADRVISRSVASVEPSSNSDGKHTYSLAAAVMRLTGNQTSMQDADGKVYVSIPAASVGAAPYGTVELIVSQSGTVIGCKPSVADLGYCRSCGTIPCCCGR